MEMLKQIVTICNIIMSISVLILCFTINYEELRAAVYSDENINGGRKSKKYLINVSAVCLCFCLYIIYVWYFNNSRIIILFIILYILKRINEFLIVSPNFFDSIISARRSRLSTNEKHHFMVFVGTVTMLSLFDIPMKIVESIRTVENQYIVSGLLIISTLIFLNIYYFATGAIFIISLLSLFSKEKKRENILTNKMYAYQKKLEKCRAKIYQRVYFSEMVSEYSIKYHNKIINFILGILHVVLVVFDIAIQMILFIGVLLLSVIELFLNITLNLINGCTSAFRSLMKTRDRKIVNLLYRSTTIVSIISIVIINRCTDLLKLNDDGTAVLEFIASAVIIPIIMSWVLDIKSGNQGDKKE